METAKNQFNEDQRDCLQELVNVAMGQAGDSLARLLEVFVHLSVPRIRIVERNNLDAALVELVGSHESVSAVRQGFHTQNAKDDVRGEAIAVFSHMSFKELAELMAYEEEIDEKAEKALLVDVTNVISSACLLGIGEQLEIDLGLTAPSILGLKIPIDRLLADQMTWKHALMVEINYSVDDRAFKCHLLMMMPETALIALTDRLDKILEEF